MLERSGLAAVLVVILAGALAADCAWARGRGGGGHGGGKRGGGGAAHASAASGGGARAAHAGAASTGGARAASAGAPVTAGGARMTAGGARTMSGNTGGTNAGAARAPAGAPAGGGGRAAFARASGGFLAFGALGAFSRIDGRFYGAPPPRSGAAVGLAAFWEVPPPNYPAPVVVVPYRSPEYIEIGPDAPVVAPPKNYWYFCPDAGGYYPYVEECPEGWELVAPPGALPIGQERRESPTDSAGELV